MKGKKRSTGGTNDAAEDIKDTPTNRNAKNNVADEASEKAAGGRTGRKSGGHVHHENIDNLKHAKHVGMVRGPAARAHGGRAPRKSGGSAGNEFACAAREGSAPAGRSESRME